MELAIYNIKGEDTGRKAQLNDEVFAIEANEQAVYLDVKQYLANQRQGTQSTLTRTEVSGGGKKPWRQKGTGHARQGSIRAPQWRKGGIALGPKPRDYSYSLNKKVRRLALKSVLSAKAAEDRIIVVDSIRMDAIKTKAFKGFLDAVKCDGKAVVITPEVDQTIVRSARNIPGVSTTTARLLNVYDIVNAKYLVIDQNALAAIEEVYA